LTAKFCEDCGATLEMSALGSTNTSNDASIRVADSPNPEKLNSERKTVTALFADIKGSMELMEDLDPEEARAIVDPALKLMIETVHRYDGYIVQSTGDGIFALFGAPVAHEDHPQRALYAALRLQEELKRYSDGLRVQGKQPLQARVGLNTGEVVVRSIRTEGGHAEYSPIGHSTGLAARMQALAPVGSISATEATRKLCEGYFTFKLLGPTVVKGVSEPINVWEVTGLGPLRTRLQRAASRGLTRFVGRDREMEALRHAAELARAGHGQILAVMAEPGVGKSRLFHEFKLVSQSDWTILEAFSISHGKASSYLPVIELLKDYFEIQTDDDQRKRRERVNGKIITLDRSLEDTLPYLLTLLSLHSGDDPLAQMDAQIKRQRTHEALKRILLRESLDRPLMLIFEDLHWIDGETQGLLNVLVDSIANARILLLVNYRPEYHHEWGNRTHYAQLRLDPLGREGAEEMLDALLTMPLARSVAGEGKRGVEPRAGEGADLAPLKRLIIEKTEGNPFFIEEIVETLFEDGSLVRNGRLALTRPLTQIKVPTTVQAVLASRIDRLAPSEKDLLQTLAVLGREFPLGLVQHVWQHPHPPVTELAEQRASTAPLALSRNEAGEGQSELDLLLSRLQLSEFIYEQPAFPEVEYAFKHALTQEVAYNSVLGDRRKLLHERAGAAMAALYANRFEDHLNELARHYERSGNTVKAIEFLERAGRQSNSRASHAEAITLFGTALELLKTLPETPERMKKELWLQLGLGSALQAIKGWSVPEVGQVFEKAHQLCQGLDASHELVEALVGLIGFYYVSVQLTKALELEEQLVSIAENGQNPDWLLKAHVLIGMTLAAMGEFASGLAHLERASSVDLSVGRSFYGAAALSWEAIVLVNLGYPDQALDRSRRAMALAREASDPLAYVNAAGNVFWVHDCHNDGQSALDEAEELLHIAVDRGFQWYSAFATVLRGEALAKLNRPDEGLTQIRDGLAAMRASAHANFSFGYVILAEALFKAGRGSEGVAVVAEALEASHRNNEGINRAELWRIRGDLLLLEAKPGCENEAGYSFCRAIEIARHQQAKWRELRATVSLARLLTKRGRHDEARTMLAEIYDWFTEGFDTSDLKDAKALLDELSS
jgi:class 3 adenylate cyclase/tetratricopeptide (TPR) repeat protein